VPYGDAHCEESSCIRSRTIVKRMGIPRARCSAHGALALLGASARARRVLAHKTHEAVYMRFAPGSRVDGANFRHGFNIGPNRAQKGEPCTESVRKRAEDPSRGIDDAARGSVSALRRQGQRQCSVHRPQADSADDDTLQASCMGCGITDGWVPSDRDAHEARTGRRCSVSLACDLPVSWETARRRGHPWRE
jgi:hypothetical protein